MGIIKLSGNEKRRLTIFISCVFLAIIAWLFFALSNNYVYSVKTVVSFKNLPLNKAFYPLQSDTVNLEVEGTGWQLLFTRLRILPNDIKVDLKALEKRNFVTFTDQIRDINFQFSSQQSIISIQPDTLYFDFTSRKVKRVPVKLVSNLKFKKQFGQSAQIQLKPDFVTVTGPVEEMKQVENWGTDTLKLTLVDAGTTEKVFLGKPKENNMSIFPNAVEVKIPVEEFTEKVIMVPIRVINNKEYYNVKLYPEKVAITFMVALSAYEDTNESSFDAVVDLDLWKNDKAVQLPVKLLKKKPYTRIRKIMPQQVDFIIKKQ